MNKSSPADAQNLRAQFGNHLQQYPLLSKVEESTKLKREDVVGVMLLGLFLLLLAGVFFKPLGIFMTRLFGFVYPCYMSIKAIESEQKEDDTQWLMYWMVFAFFTLLEETALRSIEPIAPFFFAWKIVFLLWCYLPKTKGAEFLYVELISPTLRKVTDLVRAQVGGAKEKTE
ncbi:hypothetical protein BASA81_007398 [Batrachochytrium salamandrivorans]|nr:hypothetical protein BASA81_007398 [Batrachochytrium salamandrivorans]